MSASTRWLIGIAAVLVLISVASAVVAIAVGGEQQFDEGTPERTVQRYFGAVADGNLDEALSFVAPWLLESCGEVPRDTLSYRDWRLRATLEGTSEHDGITEVRVRVTERYGSPPFDSAESSWSLVFELGHEDGEWRFVQMPWPLYCVPHFEGPDPVPPTEAPFPEAPSPEAPPRAN